jgi:uncharacterized iron-regulated membrane protein
MTFRRLLARLHAWVGLVALPVLLAVSLSGALLSIAPWALALSIPRVRADGSRVLPGSALVALVASALPPGETLASIEWGPPGRARTLTLRSGERWFVDPASGLVVGRQSSETWLERAIGAVQQVHVRLLAGSAGEWMVDLASFAALFSATSGLVLWWKSKRLRVARGSRGRRWWRELHDVTGLYGHLLILALALSGLLLAWEEPLYWLAGAQPEREPPVPHSHTPAPGEPAGIGVDEWITAATRALPGVPPMKLSLPATERSPVAVELWRTGRPGRSIVWLDRWDARVLRVDDFRTSPRAYRAHVLDRAVHTGELAGTASAAMALLGSLALALLAITGVVTWLRRPPRPARIRSGTSPPPSW